jgi:hypothetical protein
VGALSAWSALSRLQRSNRERPSEMTFGSDPIANLVQKYGVAPYGVLCFWILVVRIFSGWPVTRPNPVRILRPGISILGQPQRWSPRGTFRLGREFNLLIVSDRKGIVYEWNHLSRWPRRRCWRDSFVLRITIGVQFTTCERASRKLTHQPRDAAVVSATIMRVDTAS